MAWGIDFKADIFLNRETYSNISELKDAIYDSEKELQEIRDRIYMLTSSRPKDIVPEEWKDDVLTYLQTEVNRLFEEYDSMSEILLKRKLYLEYLKDNNIDKIDISKNF